jgi:small subunit ribosomal protein S6
VDVRKYEIMLILPADADDKVIGGVTDRISQILGAGGGSIEKVDRWGKRRFTFEIQRQSEGFYLVLECQADPAAIKELDRVLSLADEVIRFKVVVRAA